MSSQSVVKSVSVTTAQPVSTLIGLEVHKPPTSPALEWLWKRLLDVAHPHVLDCGVVRRSTIDTLLGRGVKLYMTDLVSPLQKKKDYWNYSGNAPAFRTDKFLGQFPSMPLCSLNAILCWQLFDLLPREALAPVILQMCLYLQPCGVLFCILREPWLQKGADWAWWLKGLTTLNREVAHSAPFSYAVISNREMERLIPSGKAKTFLTRAGWREVLAIK